jgi:hypothetical protein
VKRKRPGIQKEPIDPRRIRRIPADGFSWIDRRFVREGFIEPLPPEAILLYLFLVAVSDARGLSFYADPTIMKILKLTCEEFTGARQHLIHAGLILYRYPLYQVLPLPAKRAGAAFSSSAQASRRGDPESLGELLRLATEKARGSDQEADPSEEEP